MDIILCPCINLHMLYNLHSLSDFFHIPIITIMTVVKINTSNSDVTDVDKMSGKIWSVGCIAVVMLKPFHLKVRLKKDCIRFSSYQL